MTRPLSRTRSYSLWSSICLCLSLCLSRALALCCLLFDMSIKPIQCQFPLEIAVVWAGCAGDGMAGIGEADQLHGLLSRTQRGEHLLTLLNGAAVIIF